MKFILASQNSHKAQEFAQALTSIQISPSPITLDVDENGSTFIENARIKARAFATALAQNAIADDSGLSVDALQGAPGIYSARYATLPPDIDPDRTAANNRKLIRALAQTPPAQRTAHFTCALCLVIVASTDIQTTLESPTLRAAAQFYNATGTPCPASAPIADIARAEIAFEAHAYGTILDAPRGTAGFGYDPLFLSDDTHTTFAELTCDQKLSVSHRGKAIERLRSLFAP